MIASLFGTVTAVGSSSLVIDVSGVGYLVSVSSPTSAKVNQGDSLLLYTTLIVREDGFTLFGFFTSSEQRSFELLRSVTGVGPKSALSILGVLTVDQIFDAVLQENDSVFKAVSGIGPKTAKLIILTLAGKMGVATSSSSTPLSSPISEVVSALVGLGWSEKTAQDAANSAMREIGSSSDRGDLLKLSLANLGNAKSIGTSIE